jgi:hypothetical protein
MKDLGFELRKYQVRKRCPGNSSRCSFLIWSRLVDFLSFLRIVLGEYGKLGREFGIVLAFELNILGMMCFKIW